MKNNRKRMGLILGIFIGSFILLSFNFAIHCINVDTFNSKQRVVKSSDEQTKLTVNIHPRGHKTDSWPNEAAFPGTVVYGTVYEAILRNNLGYEVKDWALRVNIYQDCFINNAWCGTMEIHQRVDGKERVQTLDLRNYNESDIKLKYYKPLQDLFIPLSIGDYFIYYPSEDDNETPLVSSYDVAGLCSTGFIVYTYGEAEAFNSADFELSYYANKRYLEGAESIIFIILMPIWIVCFTLFIAISILKYKYEARLKEKDKTVIETIDVFSSFVDAKDPYTHGHSHRVAVYSKLIAEKLGYNAKECKNIYYMGLLHDIGKCYVSDDILKKTSGLTDEQRGVVKIHTIKGAEMLSNFTSIPNITNGVLYHHERYEGGGYPTGKAGKDIPIEGRIVCVADAFDAMNSDRCYRKKLTKTEIIAELQKHSGSQFDPKVVNAFLEVISEQNGINF